jgi:hypothetical protein
MARIKFNIGKDKISFSKGDGKLNQPIEPPHQVCKICNDDGLCLNNPNNPNYNDDFFGSDIYDCQEYLESKQGKPKGQWMVDWVKKMKKKKDDKPYESSFVKWSKMFPMLFLLFIGCGDLTSSEPSSDDMPVLDVMMNLPINNDGYYVFDFPNNSQSSYTSVEYISTPMERVFWYSDDYYTMIYWGREYHYPIINYSTYTASDSTGKQMIYVSSSHIGDTLSVWGCIEDLCDGVYFIVSD